MGFDDAEYERKKEQTHRRIAWLGRVIARLVAGYLGGLGTGKRAVDQPVDGERPAVQDALQLQPSRTEGYREGTTSTEL